jgi:hypothetical protein
VRAALLRAVAIVALATTTAATTACGRRATYADCRLIVDRSVELQMSEINLRDPAAVAERERQVRAELEPEIRACESRRVTDKTIACVQSAGTTHDLDECLR